MPLRNLPEGYTSRPATLEDVEQAVALFNKCSLKSAGERSHNENETAVDWQMPGFDLDRDTRVALDSGGAIVGFAEVWDVDDPHVKVHCSGYVDPEHRGRGIGTALMAWEEARALQAVALAPADARVTLNCGELANESAGRELIEASGFRAVRCYRRMVIELTAKPSEPRWPQGVTVRSFDPTRDVERALQASRDAFSDHWGHVETPYELELDQWRHWIDGDKDFDPSVWFLAEAGGSIVGQTLCWTTRSEGRDFGWIYIVAVAREWRRRGLATALLTNAFRALYDRGKTRVGLAVDSASLTGANRLYERAGMKVARESIAYEKELRPGRDLSLRSLDEGKETHE